jgi:hypothetical protein
MSDAGQSHELYRRIAELEAAVKDWREECFKASSEAKQLEADNARLEGALQVALKFDHDTIKRLEADNARLRVLLSDALELTEWFMKTNCPGWRGEAAASSVIGRCRAALK